MNERIQELAGQVGYQNDRWNSTEHFEAFLDAFAESIVRECCGVLTKNVEVALDAFGSPVYPEGLIYEHFGVEE